MIQSHRGVTAQERSTVVNTVYTRLALNSETCAWLFAVHGQ